MPEKGATGGIGGPMRVDGGFGDQLTLLRLYDGITDEKKQELLRLAVKLERKPSS